MTLQVQPSPTEHTERSGANSPSVFTSKHVSVKAGKGTYISRIVGGEVFLLCTRWECKMFVVLDSSKSTHKWKRRYDTVLCSKSAADAANLSIFTLRHVNCGLRCATSSWGHIEYMIADAWSIASQRKTIPKVVLLHSEAVWSHRPICPAVSRASVSS